MYTFILVNYSLIRLGRKKNKTIISLSHADNLMRLQYNYLKLIHTFKYPQYHLYDFCDLDQIRDLHWIGPCDSLAPSIWNSLSCSSAWTCLMILEGFLAGIPHKWWCPFSGHRRSWLVLRLVVLTIWVKWCLSDFSICKTIIFST